MNWFKDNVYIASWIFPPTVILINFLRSRNKGIKPNTTKNLIMVAFAIALAVSFTPQFDVKARSIAETLVFILVGYLIVSRNE
jgi:hypothetical protein